MQRAAVLTAGASAGAIAQQGVTTGAITGQVTDADGAPAAGAPVSVTNVETGATRLVESDEEGRYSAGFLPPGTYVVSTQFVTTAESAPVRLTIGETIVVNLSLAAIQAEEVVTEVGGEGAIDVAEGGIRENKSGSNSL